MDRRTAYVVLDEDWNDRRRLDTTYAILDQLDTDLVHGEFWIEWHISDRWPADVHAAADRLHSRFGSAKNRAEDLWFVERLDGGVRSDCLLVAPFAHDVKFLDAGPGRRSRRMVAALHDENLANVFYLTSAQHRRIQAIVGAENLRTLKEHRRLRR